MDFLGLFVLGLAVSGVATLVFACWVLSHPRSVVHVAVAACLALIVAAGVTYSFYPHVGVAA